jgi:antitoxin ParD1/3/4
MHITLKPEQEALIHTKLKSGQYQDADEVIQAALCLLDEQDRAYEQWVIEARTKVDEAAASLDRGEGLEGEPVVNYFLEKFRKSREAKD